MSVPAGFADNDMPVAFQLAGRPFAEAFVLQAGRAYEREGAWSDSAQFYEGSAPRRFHQHRIVTQPGSCNLPRLLSALKGGDKCLRFYERKPAPQGLNGAVS